MLLDLGLPTGLLTSPFFFLDVEAGEMLFGYLGGLPFVVLVDLELAALVGYGYLGGLPLFLGVMGVWSSVFFLRERRLVVRLM